RGDNENHGQDRDRRAAAVAEEVAIRELEGNKRPQHPRAEVRRARLDGGQSRHPGNLRRSDSRTEAVLVLRRAPVPESRQGIMAREETRAVSHTFDYETLVLRNAGYIRPEIQEKIRSTRLLI